MRVAVKQDFEGSAVLEKLAEIGLLDEFYAAVDADDQLGVEETLKAAGLDHESIQSVLAIIRDETNY